MIVFDSSVILLVLDPRARPPLDPETQNPVSRASERIDYLIDVLSQKKETIIIPTPVLSEVLVYAGDALPKYLYFFNSKAVFRIAGFDQKAAIEAALSIKDSLDRGGLKIDVTDPAATRGKVKFDRQIVAIAKAEGATAVYSDDSDVLKYARNGGLQAFRTADLDLPPEAPQEELDFDG